MKHEVDDARAQYVKLINVVRWKQEKKGFEFFFLVIDNKWSICLGRS